MFSYIGTGMAASGFDVRHTGRAPGLPKWAIVVPEKPTRANKLAHATRVADF